MATGVAVALLAACGSGGSNGDAAGSDSGSGSGSGGGSGGDRPAVVDYSAEQQQELIAQHDDWAKDAGPEWDKLLADGKKEGVVVLASGPNPAWRDLVSRQFEADTGIRVEFLPNAVPAEITGRLRQEAAAGQVSIDVFLTGYPGVIDELPAGLLQPFADDLVLPSVTETDNWKDNRLWWQDSEKTHLLRLLLYVTGYPTVNTDEVDPASIETWDDMLKPEFSGKIAQFDPRRPGPGSGAAVLMARDIGRDFAEKFYGQQNVTFTTDSRQLADWVARGTYPIGLGMDVNQTQELRAQGFPLEAVLPSDYPGVLTSGFGILRLFKDSPHPNAAVVLANWLASPRGAMVMQLGFAQPSLRTDVDVTENIPQEIIPQEGIDYVDQNEEGYVKESMVPGTKILNEIIGN